MILGIVRLVKKLRAAIDIVRRYEREWNLKGEIKL